MPYVLTNLMYQSTFIIMGLGGLAFLIAFHELGHFLFCKLFNIYTPSFSIGFGPVLFARKIGTTLFKLSLIPLGGYVEIAGSQEIGQGEQLHSQVKDETSFATKPFWQKFLVMIGGILFNLIFAYATFIFTFWVGAPKSQLLYPTIASSTVLEVVENSPAANIIKPGDLVLTINGEILDNSMALYMQRINTPTDNPIDLTFKREGTVHAVSLTPIVQTNRGVKTASLGIIFDMKESTAMSFKSAVLVGIQETHRWIANIWHDFRHLLAEKKFGKMAGPLMIIHTSAQLAGKGFLLFLLFLAIISINLAILNLIPIPILDGGQIVFHAIEAIFGRPLPERAQYFIHMACWISFMALFVFLSWQDIVRILTPLLTQLNFIH
ncbi:MAG TPA: site-2 protease family protein [Patescibacteria group bacterium]|jgi:regulator of sigma E protease|nr:site-2 protease family protein [Patescibacteria group bacterium]